MSMLVWLLLMLVPVLVLGVASAVLLLLLLALAVACTVGVARTRRRLKIKKGCKVDTIAGAAAVDGHTVDTIAVVIIGLNGHDAFLCVVLQSECIHRSSISSQESALHHKLFR
jgi:Na+-transporting methylmalonyl-CoA/oxaloacetate decarboxylase gamma subunit